MRSRVSTIRSDNADILGSPFQQSVLRSPTPTAGVSLAANWTPGYWQFPPEDFSRKYRKRRLTCRSRPLAPPRNDGGPSYCSASISPHQLLKIWSVNLTFNKSQIAPDLVYAILKRHQLLLLPYITDTPPALLPLTANHWGSIAYLMRLPDLTRLRTGREDHTRWLIARRSSASS